MKYTKILLFLILIVAASTIAGAQTKPKANSVKTSSSNTQAVKSSPAFAELLLRKTELTAELENFLADYTEEFPKVKELRFELDLLTRELNRVLSVNTADAAKLSPALGKLMLRKIELETDVWNLLKQYNDEHPDVKQAKRKVEVFEAAIREIL